MRSKSYHHGSLRIALLAAAEMILARDGLPGLTLRATAREAGVSHAAPAHHFGDLTGLLSELATIGFNRFNGHLTAAALAAGSDPQARLTARGKAYVAFARLHPNLFLLMFRGERIDRGRPILRAAAEQAFMALRDATAAVAGGDPEADAIRIWSLVHGFTMLMIDGQLPPCRDVDGLLDAVLAGHGHGRPS